jgi:hypothetical protein
MKINALLLAGAFLFNASGALAQTSHGVFTSPDFNLTFDISTQPTSLINFESGFQVAVSGTLNGSSTTFDTFDFISSDYFGNGQVGGGFSYNDSFDQYFRGAQLYSGTTAAPTILNGTYTLTSYSNGVTGTLTITGGAGAVPEPATWALMIGGFGMVGATMRRRATQATAIIA